MTDFILCNTLLPRPCPFPKVVFILAAKLKFYMEEWKDTNKGWKREEEETVLSCALLPRPCHSPRSSLCLAAKLNFYMKEWKDTDNIEQEGRRSKERMHSYCGRWTY